MADTYADSPEYRALDQAINAWFAKANPEFMTTGWVVLGSAIRVANLPDDAEAGYQLAYQISSGTSPHTAIGMTTYATDLIINPRVAGDL